MKRLLVMVVVLLAATSLMAGGKDCARNAEVKSVELTGAIECREGSGEDCARVFRVANSGKEYSVCNKSKVKLTSLDGANVRISGKLVKCSDTEGQELMIDKAAKI